MASTPPSVYVLDTNVFVEAHKRYYAFPLCPGYWQCLPYYFTAGRILSIDKVRAEILPGDALHEWVANTCPSGLFDSTSTVQIAAEFAKIMAWANANTQFTPTARAVFAAAADGWLVAYAKVKNCVVVTHEEFAPQAKARIMLPNVCRQMGVGYLDTFAMLKDLKATFNWSA